MSQLQVTPIGWVLHDNGKMFIKLESEYATALTGLGDFSHLNVLWWFDDFDTAEARAVREAPKPYRLAPETLGIFATRSPVRPNPIALTTVGIIGVDVQNAVIQVDWIDANDGTPVIDLKPYTPSADRVEAPTVPQWCAHWPKSLDTSENFDWEREFNF